MIDLGDLASRARNALDRMKRSRDEWIIASIGLAMVLREARERLPSNERFSCWLNGQGIAVSKDDRAALIRLASDPDAARAILEEDATESWRHAAKQLQQSSHTTASRISQAAKTHGPQIVRSESEGANVFRIISIGQSSSEPLPHRSIKLRPRDLPEAAAKLQRPYEAKVVEALASFCDTFRDAPCCPDPARVVEAWALTRGDGLSADELRNLASWLNALVQAVEDAPHSEPQTAPGQ